MRLSRISCIIIGVLLLSLYHTVSAQNESFNSVYKQVASIAEKYRNEKGIKSFVASNGVKLQTIKIMLRKEFGKEFVDNIKTFAIILYKDAHSEVVERIVADIEQVVTPLQIVNIENQLKPGAKGRGYVRLSDDEQWLNDLLIVMETPSPKLIYFGGTFEADNIKYKNK